MAENPLLPGWFDLLWMGAAAAYLVLVVVAIALVWRERESLDTPRTLLWCLVAIAAPVIFLVAWFITRPKTGESAAEPKR